MDLRTAPALALAHGTAILEAIAGDGRDAIVSRAATHRLASLHTWRLTTSGAPPHRITRAVIGVPEERLAHLDARGRVQIGTVVAPGMILVGRESPRSELLVPPEERRLEQMRREAPRPSRDSSLRCPPQARGVVVAVDVEGDLVHVTIEIVRPLAVGDVLRHVSPGTGGSIAVVGAISDLPAELSVDVIGPGWSGPCEIEKVVCAEERMHARSIGPYSQVTRQPLPGKEQFGGQRVREGALAALLARGAAAIVHELLTIKSDDDRGRVAAYESIVRGAPACRAEVPAATLVVEAELRALGLETDLVDDPEPRLRLASPGGLRELAPDAVEIPDTLDARTHRPIPGGLFCEQIFGPIGSPDRRTRLARIDLPVPVVHPLGTEIVAELLAMSEAGVLAADAETLRRSLAALEPEASPAACAELLRAMRAADVLPEDLVVDAIAVLPPDLRPLVPLDDGRWATSDLNDLYLDVLEHAEVVREAQADGAPEDEVRAATIALRRAVDAVARNGTRELPSAPTVHRDGRTLRSLVAMLAGPEGALTKALWGKTVDYSGVAIVIERPLGIHRALVPRTMALELWKPWLYAELEREGHAASIKSAKVLVEGRDARALAALDRIVSTHPLVLLAEGGEEWAWSVDVALHDEPAIALSPATIASLGISPGEPITVHVPIDPRAIEEARTVLRGPARELASSEPGWIARAARAGASTLARVLIEAALRGERDPGTGPVARIVVGRSPDA